ncbi:hypothetical protein HYALB_00013541 [Hymenoscyphus albidus]|uniref:Uncharacterized protein n=1 Tax=Hymenoscyphus albidus TaxID=595503 RepID=A0A9N9PZ70_9HELO|nr:hypothetical protein HYALB_00013541 [Hymenoscyphus albidus]
MNLEWILSIRIISVCIRACIISKAKFAPNVEREAIDAPLLSYFFPSIYQQMVNDAEETFELDPDEEMNLDALKPNIDDDKALATRALTLVRQNKDTPTINFVVLKAA